MNTFRYAIIPAALCAALSMTTAAAPSAVESSCTVLDLGAAGKKTVKLTLQATEAGGPASGSVSVDLRGETTEIDVSVRDLPAAENGGVTRLTHVLWAVDAGGGYTRLAELVAERGRARASATLEGPTFGLLVTAEPYFAVTRPADTVVLYAVAEGKAAKNVESGATACTLVDAAYYAFGRTDVAIAVTLKRDARTTGDLLQARHAYKIAELAGAERWLPEDLEAVAALLLDAERLHAAKAGSPTAIEQARRSVNAAEQVRAMAEQAALEAEDARRAAELEAEAARERERLAAERRAAEEAESRRAADEQRRDELARLAQEREAQEAELARLAAEREALRAELDAETARRARELERPLEADDSRGAADAAADADAVEDAAGEAADASLAAERSRLAAERVRLEAQRTRQQADAEAERARIEAERATLRAQLAEDAVARERETNATVKAEIEEARKQAEQARIEAELARRDAELAAERARLEVERAQLDAQRKAAESEAALRQQYQAEAAERNAERTEEQRQAELERLRQQFELEQQQGLLDSERETLQAERLAEQQALEQSRAALDSERGEIVARLAADQARLAADREELERTRREEQARLEAEEQAAEAARELELAQGRAAMQADFETRQAAMERDMDAERARLEAEMRAEIEAERARLRAAFEQQSARIEQDAAAAEVERVRAAEADRLARREQLLGQLTNVLDARDSDRGLLVNLAGVSFAAGRHELQPDAREKLARVAGILLAHPSLAVAIEGHTDSTGSASGNQLLSERRAEAVRDYLVSQGLQAQAMTVAGLGSTVPLASNETPDGRRANRRIELIISGALIER